MVDPVALLPFAAAVLSAALAAVAGVAPRRSRPAVRWFLLVNLANCAWSFAYFVQLEWGRFPDPSLAPPGTWDTLLLVAMALGVGLSPTYWFLFAAASARNRLWPSTPGVLIAHVPAVYTVIVSVTNPFHHLFMRVGPGGVAPGPLALPHYVGSYALIAGGVWMFASRVRSHGLTVTGRRQAAVLAATAVMVLLGSLTWATRRVTGIPIPLNPTPLLFTAVDCIVAYQVVYRGLAEIVPLSTLSAIMENTDTHLAYLGPDFRFVSVNEAFVRRSGHIEAELIGRGYFEVFPDRDRLRLFERACQTGRPVEQHDDADLFPRRAGTPHTFWSWSLSPVTDATGDLQGFVLSLTDVTESVSERELSRTLAVLDVRVHRGFASDTALAEVVAEAAAALDCSAALVVMSQDRRWRIMQHCERPMATWELYSARDFPHIELATEGERTVAIPDALNSLRLEPTLMRALGIRSALVVPLLSRGAAIGAVSFERSWVTGRFSTPQVDFAERFAAAVTLALENARLYEGERRIAQTLQESMLRLPPYVPGVDFSHTYRSATEAARVGGDFYDLFQTEDGRVGVLIGDVAGHGIEAAVLTSLIKNGVRAEAMETPSPARVLQKVSEVLRRQTEPEVFATAFLGMLDVNEGVLTYCSAGHPPSMIVREQGGVRELVERSVVLGVVEGVAFEEGRSQLEPGDVLVMYTDGLTEARRDREFFGQERLGASLAELAGRDADDVVHEVFDAVRRFADDEFSDDVAMLAVRLLPRAARLTAVPDPAGEASVG